jgi:hypothetical protein
VTVTPAAAERAGALRQALLCETVTHAGETT